MRIPTFSRQSDTADAAEADRPAAAGSATTPVRPRRGSDDTTVTNLPPAPPPTVTPPPANPPTVTPPRRTEAQRAADLGRDDTADLRRPGTEKVVPVAPAGPKPRASLLATLGLILAVAAAMLVLSGPLLGYGIGVAGLALVLSLAGIHATGKRHVAGKVDALIGLFLSLAAIVVGVLALTGSLHWLGTNLHPVESVRHWLDVKFGNRF